MNVVPRDYLVVNLFSKIIMRSMIRNDVVVDM
jgi:hypothetical protein